MVMFVEKECKTKFVPGRIVVTNKINMYMEQYPEFHLFIIRSLKRHINCDWGDVCITDWNENNISLIHGYRLLSVYIKPACSEHRQWKIYIITEADRSATTVLFADEY